MPASVDILAILITGLLLGNEIAVAVFIHPALSRLAPHTHLMAARAIAITLGRAMPFWYGLGLLAVLAELWLYRAHEPAFHLLLAAAILWAATIILTLLLLVPRNNRIAASNPEEPYLGWEADRAAWDRLHRLRVLLLATAFTLLLIAVVPCTL